MKPFIISCSVLVTFVSTFQARVEASVFRTQFQTDSAYLVVEVLDEDLIHFEISNNSLPPSLNQPLYTSPMVLKTDYLGPSNVLQQFNIIQTRELKIEVIPDTLCIRAYDRQKSDAFLTEICPFYQAESIQGFQIEPGEIENIYGLGQQFKKLGSADGDWTALGVRDGLEFGNGFQGFQDAAVGNIQIPVFYAVGQNNLNYAVFIDNIYKQRWDWTTSPWQVQMPGNPLRFYLMSGADLPDLRADFMELTGRPPVPPRKAFGLWVSEFGYDNWEEIDRLKTGLRDNNFPVDGFVLDLNWFGGVALNNPSQSNMGRLDWDQNQTDFLRNNSYSFPNPDDKIQDYADEYIALAAIEESYLANTVDTFTELPPDLSVYQRTNGECNYQQQLNPITDIEGFWGIGRMIDWSDPEAGEWIHKNRRFPNLIEKGIHVHWTDLGEPENYQSSGCYDGVKNTGKERKIEHADIHNLYNFLWNQSIWQGYFDGPNQQDNLGIINPRPLILTRSGTAGTQRYGTAMWSGDIASNLQSLATHFNAMMHMSFSGIDYYGSDIGGFRREVMPFNDKQGSYRGYEDELYTQWFANGSWFDVPIRPHTDNEFVKVNPPYQTSPHLVGKLDSNLANLRQRYELIPYYYSLAYRAYLYGEPVIAPPVFYYQNDRNLRQMGAQKLIGKNILVGVVAQHGEYERDVYLPTGEWINYHSNETAKSEGEWVKNIPIYRNSILRLPTFVKAGSILPLMVVERDTLDAFGHRKEEQQKRDELRLRIYADETASQFTLYEDDGKTLNYQDNGRPIYDYRTTEISQQQQQNTVIVKIEPGININNLDGFEGANNRRANEIELIVDNAEATTVRLNNQPLTQYSSLLKFRLSESGWYNAGNNKIFAKSDEIAVESLKEFEFELQSISPKTSVNFVCDNISLNAARVDVVGSLPELGNWDINSALPLDPSINYEYIINPPQSDNRPGPHTPIWTGIIDNLPPNQAFEWKCIQRNSDGEIITQPGDNNTHTTRSSGYSGRSYGQF
ncbi:MAG: TIM-barrel domain-containing protein [Microcoleaceae cyanobacterium]